MHNNEVIIQTMTFYNISFNTNDVNRQIMCISRSENYVQNVGYQECVYV